MARLQCEALIGATGTRYVGDHRWVIIDAIEEKSAHLPAHEQLPLHRSPASDSNPAA